MNSGDVIWREETKADGWEYGVMLQQPQLNGTIHKCAFIRHLSTNTQYLFYQGWGCDKELISIDMLQTVADAMDVSDATMCLSSSVYDMYMSDLY